MNKRINDEKKTSDVYILEMILIGADFPSPRPSSRPQ